MEKKMFTRKEAAQTLNVSTITLDAYLRRTENPLPCIRMSATGGRGKVLIPTDALTRWIEEETARNQIRMGR